MSEQPVVDTTAAPYKESDDFVPDPTAVFGTLETSGTAGGDNEKAEKISPIFDAAKAQDLQYAARALDPDDKDVDDSSVVVSTGSTVVAGDPEADRERVRRAAAAYEKEPVKVEDPSLEDREKDLEKSKGQSPVERAAAVEGQQQQASAAGGTGKGSDDATQRAEQGQGGNASKAQASKNK